MAIRIGPYLIEEENGRGGAAVVYRARDPLNRRDVAVKTLRIDSSSGAHERFLRECASAGELRHPNVAAVYDVGTHDGHPYLVMELVDGRPLDLRRPRREVVGVLAKVARALESVHLRGVVHRDLKPGNILVDRRGEPRIVDFGLALYLGSKTVLTRTGFAVGTPAYMAPEQVLGWRELIGPATDIYAIGAMLYEALSGRHPHGRAFAEVWKSIHDRREPPLPRGPKKLAAICRKAMAREVADRHPRAGALADALEGWLRPRRKRRQRDARM